MSRAMLEPRSWMQHRAGSGSNKPHSRQDKPADAIRFEHVTRRGGVMVVGQQVVTADKDEWYLRVLVDGKEVETRISTSAYEDALDLLTCWRPR